MASPAAIAEYKEDRQLVIDELAESGYLASFGNNAAAGQPDEPDGAYAEVGKANVLPIPFNADFSEDVRRQDKFFFVDGQLPIREMAYMRDADSTIYKVQQVEELKLDGQTLIIFEIQCRSVG